MRLISIFCLFISTGFATSNAEAFPELTRHGYASCIACHVSPNGGGVLTPYGRNLSLDMLSTWGNPREAEVLHGILPKRYMDDLEGSKFRIGGNVRTVQTHRANRTVRSGNLESPSSPTPGLRRSTSFATRSGRWGMATSPSACRCDPVATT